MMTREGVKRAEPDVKPNYIGVAVNFIHNRHTYFKIEQNNDELLSANFLRENELLGTQVRDHKMSIGPDSENTFEHTDRQSVKTHS